MILWLFGAFVLLIIALFVSSLFSLGLLYIGCLVAGEALPNFFRALAAVFLSKLVIVAVNGLLVGALTGVMILANFQPSLGASIGINLMLLLMGLMIAISLASAFYERMLGMGNAGTVATVQYGVPVAFAFVLLLLQGAMLTKMQNDLAAYEESGQQIAIRSSTPSYSRPAPPSQPSHYPPPPDPALVAPPGPHPGHSPTSPYSGQPTNVGHDPALADPLAAGGGGTSTQPRSTIPATLGGKARHLFDHDSFSDGLKYQYAATLVEDDPTVFRLMRWCPALGRPTLAVRWGVGVESATLLPEQEVQSDLGAQPSYNNPPVGASSAPIAPPLDPVASSAHTTTTTTASSRDQESSESQALEELSKYTAGVGPELYNQVKFRSSIAGLSSRPIPTLEYLGVGQSRTELLNRSREQNCQAVFLVKLHHRVTGLKRTPHVDLTIGLLNPDSDTGEAAWTSERLNSRRYLSELQRGKNLAAPLVKLALDEGERQFPLTPLASLSTEQVQARMVKVSRAFLFRPLAVLTELHYYQRNELLDEEQFRQLLVDLLGEANAETLHAGEPEERLSVIDRYLPDFEMQK